LLLTHLDPVSWSRNHPVVTDWSRISGSSSVESHTTRGSVTKREGSWTFVVDRGIDPVTGKRRQQRRSGFRTRQVAEDALRRIIQQLTDGTFVERTDQTVDEYLTEWLAGLTTRRQVKDRQRPGVPRRLDWHGGAEAFAGTRFG